MCNCKSSVFKIVLLVLLVVGGLNWGLVGLSMLLNADMEWNLVTMLFGAWPVVEAVVYLLVGIAALLKLVCLFKCCGSKCCGSQGCSSGGCCAGCKGKCDGSCSCHKCAK